MTLEDTWPPTEPRRMSFRTTVEPDNPVFTSPACIVAMNSWAAGSGLHGSESNMQHARFGSGFTVSFDLALAMVIRHNPAYRVVTNDDREGRLINQFFGTAAPRLELQGKYDSELQQVQDRKLQVGAQERADAGVMQETDVVHCWRCGTFESDGWMGGSQAGLNVKICMHCNIELDRFKNCKSTGTLEEFGFVRVAQCGDTCKGCLHCFHARQPLDGVQLCELRAYENRDKHDATGYTAPTVAVLSSRLQSSTGRWQAGVPASVSAVSSYSTGTIVSPARRKCRRALLHALPRRARAAGKHVQSTTRGLRRPWLNAPQPIWQRQSPPQQTNNNKQTKQQQQQQQHQQKQQTLVG